MARLTPLCSPLFFIMFIFSIGCSGGSGGPTWPDDLSDIEGVSRFIRADLGGSIESLGARVYIPPNALPADTDITLKHIGPGRHIGGYAIAGGVEIFPHLVDLNGPILIEFPIVPGAFKSLSFPQGYYWSESAFVPLYFQDGTPSHALISDDTESAMMSTDHLSAFVLLMDQANSEIDGTDVAFSALENIQLKGDIPVYYDDDILIDTRMKYYIGGWPQVYGSEKWLPELFSFAHPGEVVSPDTRYEIYHEIFGDILVMNSFARFYNEDKDAGYPYQNPMAGLVAFFTQLKADQALRDYWVKPGGANDYYAVMDSGNIFQGYTFIEYMAQSEKDRYMAVSDAIEIAIADGTIPVFLGEHLYANGLRLKGMLDDEFNFFLRLSADHAIARMNCDALESLCDGHVFTDPSAESAARDCIDETRSALDRSHVNFANAVVYYISLDPVAVFNDNGIFLFSSLVFTHVTGGSRNLCTPLSYGAFYPLLRRHGQPEDLAQSIAYHAASINAGSMTFGLERYLDDEYSWEPIVFTRNLQRATLAGNLAGELLNHEIIATLGGEPGVATESGFAEIMRANLGYIYSRLKYNAWAYMVKSNEMGSYDWLGESSPWQINNILLELDPVENRNFRTESNGHLNENIYHDIIGMMDHLVVPVPDVGPGLDITIE